MTRDSHKRQIRVGLFLLVGFVVTGIAIFAIGSQSGLFQSKLRLYVYFPDVSGLVIGAPVRLAGLDIGAVSGVEFAEDLKRRNARITLSVKSSHARRIRRDSAAMIDSKGLLGDKIINITLGAADQPPVKDGDTLKTRSSPSIEQLTEKVDEAITAVTQVTKTANSAIEVLATEQVRNDVARITHSLAGILERVDRGPGLVHAAFYDPEYPALMKATLEGASGTLEHLSAAVRRVDTTLAAVEHGEGVVHEMFYGDTGRETLTELRDAMGALSSISREVRDGQGLLHNVIFDRDGGRSLRELGQAATRLNNIMGEIEKGRGTIGGLLIDPSVYEDVKTILGNVQRNVLLKHLIRYTIKEGDIERPANLNVKTVNVKSVQQPALEGQDSAAAQQSEGN